MTTENSDPIVMPSAPPRRSTRFILFAGVAGACALGVGAGLWARPAMNERQSAAARHAEEAPAAPAPARQLQIVVDDRIPPPAPTAPVVAPPKAAAVPQMVAPAKAAPAPELPPEEPQLPKRAPEGLMRILGPAFALGAEKLTHPHFAAPPTVPDEPASKHVAKTAPPHAPSAEATRLAKAQADAERQARLDARLEAKQEARRAAKAEKVELAHAEAAKLQAQTQAKTEAKAAAHRTELAKAAAHRAELARQAKAKDEQVQLAKAEARGRAQALAEARQEKLAQAERAKSEQLRLASLVRSLVHDMQHKAKPAPAPVQTARLDHRHSHKARVEQAAARKAHAMPKLTQAAHRSAPRIEPAPPQPHASGLMRVSTRCASHDPGEAIVCADPNLGAADRQLTRAYQGARAAGVPDAQLRQQQQRWLAARSSAAREAPWAVRDVYLARIAELNGQAREARPDGN